MKLCFHVHHVFLQQRIEPVTLKMLLERLPGQFYLLLSIRAYPSTTVLPKNKNGSSWPSTSTSSICPSIFVFSTCNEQPSMKSPSAGTWSPGFRNTMSPTTTLHIDIDSHRPLLRTSTWGM